MLTKATFRLQPFERFTYYVFKKFLRRRKRFVLRTFINKYNKELQQVKMAVWFLNVCIRGQSSLFLKLRPITQSIREKKIQDGRYKK
ncbi:hypothetical protein OUZ56_028498 [Daphnia magna]|uniref:Uncharacterized protein n=1 Tax=Daphnia magna TaxID=35525 RepID=A0ABR0B416_9CRUS|nr:hypothetical protein OUZ56_028498 [Daphnia magna]